jgi:transglutaminase-like putative cysteine protease
MKLLTVRHVTTYRYKQPVSFGEHRMMLRPRDSYDQRLIEAKLTVDPEPSALNWMHDAFGNCVAIARFTGRADKLTFDSSRTSRSTTRSPTARRRSPICCGRSSGNISIASAMSTAGRTSSCASRALPARASCSRR